MRRLRLELAEPAFDMCRHDSAFADDGRKPRDRLH